MARVSPARARDPPSNEDLPQRRALWTDGSGAACSVLGRCEHRGGLGQTRRSRVSSISRHHDRISGRARVRLPRRARTGDALDLGLGHVGGSAKTSGIPDLAIIPVTWRSRRGSIHLSPPLPPPTPLLRPRTSPRASFKGPNT